MSLTRVISWRIDATIVMGRHVAQIATCYIARALLTLYLVHTRLTGKVWSSYRASVSSYGLKAPWVLTFLTQFHISPTSTLLSLPLNPEYCLWDNLATMSKWEYIEKGMKRWRISVFRVVKVHHNQQRNRPRVWCHSTGKIAVVEGTVTSWVGVSCVAKIRGESV